MNDHTDYDSTFWRGVCWALLAAGAAVPVFLLVAMIVAGIFGLD